MMQTQEHLGVERLCHLGQVSRASFYRWRQASEGDAEGDVAMRHAVQQVVLSHRRRYGYRRVTAELRRQGYILNHKRVARLMREDNLLALQQRRFVSTTESGHRLPLYLNLAARLHVTGPNQLWVADITYVRLQRQFVYLAVILDAYSRKVVGWALDDSLQVRLTLRALERAWAERKPAPGLVHHSDRGIQYAAQEYVEVLQRYGIVSSMSRPANPWDNAMCESFMKTLKQEEIEAMQYADLPALQTGIAVFLDQYYNRQRLHSALGYRTPEEFELAGTNSDANLGARFTLSFLRHEEIYRSDEEWKREPPGSDSLLHRLDESPVEYSLASCSPAELASASPTETHRVTMNLVRRSNVSER